ncbi:MAG: hypothetical protein U0790_15630 [Isosphaeraceae bacterium]
MSWLSRLLPRGMRTQPRSERRRALAAKRRRRVASLEGLETRTVLSSVTTTLGFVSGTLTITADKLDNQFSIAEFRAGGGTRVTITALDADTLINGGTTWTSPGSVNSIIVNLQSGAAADQDVIQVYGEGKGVAQSTKGLSFNAGKTNLDLTVADINNPGTFRVLTAGGLNLKMDNAKWSALTISQKGGGPANIEITDTDVSGAVTVKEGWGDGSSIRVDNSVFGSTVLSQYGGSRPKGLPDSEGDGNSITVTDSQLANLVIQQKGDGDDNVVDVDNVLAAQDVTKSFGVSVIQGDGDGNIVTINEVGVFGTPKLRSGPCPGISVIQGDGAGVFAGITDSTVPGDVSIAQGDGAGDSAIIENVHAGMPGSSDCGSISIRQGDGKADSASITDSSTAELDISINQGDGELDEAEISDVTSGGGISIYQGKALLTGDPKKDPHGGDTALISSSTADEDVSINQVTVASPTSSGGGSATIDAVESGESIHIFQGNADESTAAITGVVADGNVGIQQGNGKGNTAVIEDASIVEPKGDWGSIWINQGDGEGVAAEINDVAAEGYVRIGQGNGDGDRASIAQADAGEYISIHQLDGDADWALIESSEAGQWIGITQGGGDGDEATVACSVAVRDVNVSQGDGDLNVVNILGVKAGSVDYSKGYPIDVYGTVTVTQGDGYANLVNVDDCDGTGNEINNLVINQGDSVPYVGCEKGLSDTIEIDDSFITSDIIIWQGYSPSKHGPVETGFGDYVVSIGTEGLVEAYGYTLIHQSGEQNTLLLGGASGEGSGDFDFITTWLDAWQGAGGGGFVVVLNTWVQYGPYTFPFNLNVGGDGNTLKDLGGNEKVSYSEVYNVIP